MKNRNSGFTLVELMVVVLLVALLGLVTVQIPLFSFSSWRKGSERLKLQRDAHLAMMKIQWKLRPASLSNVNVDDPSILVIDPGTDPGTDDDEKFFLDVNRLVYQDPAGVQETVMEGDAVTLFQVFQVTPGGGEISIKLKLEKENIGTVVLETAVKPRN